jgi:hypothetical protein
MSEAKRSETYLLESTIYNGELSTTHQTGHSQHQLQLELGKAYCPITTFTTNQCQKWLRVARNRSQAMPCLILAESLALISISYNLMEQKVMAFVVMKPYQLPPDPWISSIIWV